MNKKRKDLFKSVLAKGAGNIKILKKKRHRKVARPGK